MRKPALAAAFIHEAHKGASLFLAWTSTWPAADAISRATSRTCGAIAASSALSGLCGPAMSEGDCEAGGSTSICARTIAEVIVGQATARGHW